MRASASASATGNGNGNGIGIGSESEREEEEEDGEQARPGERSVAVDGRRPILTRGASVAPPAGAWRLCGLEAPIGRGAAHCLFVVFGA